MAQDVQSPWNLSIRERLKQVNPVVCLLIAIFAFSSWIDMYGVWVELPILVRFLPEGWSLPSNIMIIANCAVVFPMTYGIIVKLCPMERKRREVVTCFFIMSVGATASILIAFLWDKTAVINGVERSVALLSLCAMLCIVDTVSTIVYLPYMDRFKPHYMPYYMAGEELGGMIAGFMGLAQGAGAEATCVNTSFTQFNEETGRNVTNYYVIPIVPEPRFSVSSFFIFLCLMLCSSIVAFSLINFTKLGKREMLNQGEKDKNDANDDEKKSIEKQELEYLNLNGVQKEASKVPTFLEIPSGAKNSVYTAVNKDDINEKDNKFPGLDDNTSEIKVPGINKKRVITLFIFGAIVTFMCFGVNPSVQPYACLPYGNLAYTLAVRLCTILNPIAAVLAFFLPTNSLKVFIALGVTDLVCVSYFIFLALQSPFPPMLDSGFGMFHVILISVVISTFFTYLRTNLAATLRLEGGANGTLYVGFSIQLGGVLGGVTGFLMVNVFNLFQGANPCA